MTQDKYFFGKVEDARAYLNATDQVLLHGLLTKIHEGRAKVGKRVNSYVVVNTADPYGRAATKGGITLETARLQNWLAE